MAACRLTNARVIVLRALVLGRFEDTARTSGLGMAVLGGGGDRASTERYIDTTSDHLSCCTGSKALSVHVKVLQFGLDILFAPNFV